MTDGTDQGSGRMRPETSSKLGSALERVPALRTRLEALPAAPLAGSTCWSDRYLGPPGERPAATAGLKLAVAIDHLSALRQQILGSGSTPGTLPVYAHLSLLRPVLEASVQTRWLIADGIPPKERVGRAVSCALSDLGWLEEAEADLRATGWAPSASYAGATAPRDHVRQDALARGLTLVKMPSTTRLMRDFALDSPARDAMLFRYTSGVLHVQAWASLMGGGAPELTPTGLLIRLEADEEVAVGFVAAAIGHFERAVDEYERYLTTTPKEMP
jgi:hypothetical protein